MRQIRTQSDRGENVIAESKILNDGVSLKSFSSEFLNPVYRELEDFPVRDHDPMSELEFNIQALNEIQQRFSFIMREVKYLIRG